MTRSLHRLGALFSVVVLLAACSTSREDAPGDGDHEAVGPTVEYVSMNWVQRVDVDCGGRRLEDNGGFDDATIEIWGPTEGNRFRADVTAPNGIVESLITDFSPEGRLLRAWATLPLSNRGGGRTFDDTVFRNAECVLEGAGFTESEEVASPPYFPMSLPFPEFVQISEQRQSELAARLTEIATTTTRDTWLDQPVTVYSWELPPIPGDGGVRERREYWVSDDGLTQRTEWQREFPDGRRDTVVVEVIERRTRALEAVDFSTAPLHLAAVRPGTTDRAPTPTTRGP